ncbi:uncharacterized protein LOC131328932 [Rhododendron vialii]|uniref:uncharacterized protein LOC131328932 n=1 Tax=Rhododendron vialii TaxID=182163 RepID=UPI00265E3F75|nr:uncharacterized protein LOC131328932 [Rhododendron vialii]
MGRLGKLLAAATCFWSKSSNALILHCGLLSPTVLDVSHLTGLSSLGREFVTHFNITFAVNQRMEFAYVDNGSPIWDLTHPYLGSDPRLFPRILPPSLSPKNNTHKIFARVSPKPITVRFSSKEGLGEVLFRSSIGFVGVVFTISEKIINARTSLVDAKRDDEFTVEVHHLGHFVEDPLRYVGGFVNHVDNCEQDKWSKLEVEDIVERLGYTKYKMLWYRIPELGLEEGLSVVGTDKDAMDMATYVKGHEQIEVYVEHVIEQADESINIALALPLPKVGMDEGAKGNPEVELEDIGGRDMGQTHYRAKASAPCFHKKVAFYLFWICRFLLAVPGLGVTKEYLNLAICLAQVKRLALAPNIFSGLVFDAS